jgi:hypothetical protein
MRAATKSNARRIISAAARVESQPYAFGPGRRLPRLATGSVFYWCVPSGAVAGGTLPPSGAPGAILAGQTIYSETNGVYAALAGTHGVRCNYPAGAASGLLLKVEPNPDGVFRAVAQSCT